MGPAESVPVGGERRGRGREEGMGAALWGRRAGGPTTPLRKAEVEKLGRVGSKEAWV